MRIFIIAIYGGESKPNSLSEYLADFVNELNHLIQNGLNFYVKGERCCVPGTFGGRVVFNYKIEYPKRNEELFKQFGYSDHQNTVSPLTETGIDVINLFPLDYMHLVCLVAVRRILNYLKKDQVEKYLLTRLMKFQVYFYH